MAEVYLRTAQRVQAPEVLSVNHDNNETYRQTDGVLSVLQPTWLIGLGRARNRDKPVSIRPSQRG